MSDLYTENYKTSMKEIREDLSKWKHIPCQQTGHLILLDGNTTQIDLQIECNSYQNPNHILCRHSQGGPKIQKEIQRTKIAKSILKKKEVRRPLHNFKTCYKAKVIKAVVHILISGIELRIQK